MSLHHIFGVARKETLDLLRLASLWGSEKLSSRVNIFEIFRFVVILLTVVVVASILIIVALLLTFKQRTFLALDVFHFILLRSYFVCGCFSVMSRQNLKFLLNFLTDTNFDVRKINTKKLLINTILFRDFSFEIFTFFSSRKIWGNLYLFPSCVVNIKLACAR